MTLNKDPYNDNINLIKVQWQYMQELRDIVETGKDPLKQFRKIYDYPNVTSVCQRNIIGKGYSSACKNSLKSKRPPLNNLVKDEITKLGHGDPVQVVKDENGKAEYYLGTCAEDMAATELIDNSKMSSLPLKSEFVHPLRTRTGEEIDMCSVCDKIFR